MVTEDDGVGAPLRVDTERREDAVVVRGAGEVDSYTAPLLRDRLAAAFTDAKSGGLPVVLDLSGVAFFASSGLSVLVEYHLLGVDRGTPLRLVAPAGSVLRALRATTLNELLELYFSLPEALAAR
ncbi:STAS domain-containing protein [Lentzea tibetensis]|uniref:Anti-sigma factor antagonist n=1 Tax=Lentzea tibetensis TaxID=2591470 RepID=A0A563F1M0_9PSEU|nr:STAS domain-containing protein [Lentzea tibetensis]TWP53641.1 STAS domain-containing protein [Lentzea tibetensis]